MARFIYWLRRFVKSRLCRWTTIIEYCHDCGARQPVVWTASNELYSRVTDIQPHDSSGNIAGCLCPTCFDKRAERKGISLRWVPSVEFVAGEGSSFLERWCNTPDRLSQFKTAVIKLQNEEPH